MSWEENKDRQTDDTAEPSGNVNGPPWNAYVCRAVGAAKTNPEPVSLARPSLNLPVPGFD